MPWKDQVAAAENVQRHPDGDLLRPLLGDQVAARATLSSLTGVVVGELLAIADEGRTPLVTFPGQQGSSGIPARTTVDLHGAHIGVPLALMFESGDPDRPVVLGVLRDGRSVPIDRSPGTVDVDADGERLVVTASRQLVLRCGKASITLTRAGKVLIEGAYVSSRSSGVNRIKGGSVQLN